MNNLRKNGWSLDQKGSGGVAFLEDSGRSGAPGATTLCKCDRIPHVMYAKAQKSRIGLAATGALLCASLLSTGSASAERLVTTRNPRVVKGEFGAKSASQRITGVRYPDGVVELYKLRPDGTRLGLKSVVGMPSGVPLGPDAFADTVGTLSKHVEYSIDARDGLSGIQDLVSGEIGTVAQDAAGRMTTFEFDGVSRTMTWDAADRLVGIVQNGQTSSYTYDYRGWRTSKATPGESVTYTWGADDLVAEEATTADGTLPVRTYLQGPRMGLVLGIAEGSTAQLFAHDALGSVVARVQPQAGGVTTALHRYDAWGEMREVPGLYSVPGAGVNQVGYTGHGFDVESGLVYAKARYLDDEHARWFSADPILGDLHDPLSLLPFFYAKGGPTRFRDPDGRWTVADAEAAHAACVGEVAGYRRCVDRYLALVDARRDREQAQEEALDALGGGRAQRAISALGRIVEQISPLEGYNAWWGEQKETFSTYARNVHHDVTTEANPNNPYQETLDEGAQRLGELGVDAVRSGVEAGAARVLRSVELAAEEEVIWGGPHRLTSKKGKVLGTESHHLIADDASDLATSKAPAVRMSVNDHYETDTWGPGGRADRARERQRRLVNAGDHDEAFRLGVQDYVQVVGPEEAMRALEQLRQRMPRRSDGGIDWSKIKKKKTRKKK